MQTLLKNYNSFKIGGPAKFFVEVRNKEQLLKLDFSARGGSAFGGNKIFILGGGTNVLFNDRGFDGLIIKNSFREMELNDNLLTLGAGEQISDILDFCVVNNLSGLEWAGGLPGTIGGAARGNAGAFGGEIKDSVFQVESMNLITKKIIRRKNEECKFGYRDSIFKNDAKGEIILSVVLKLKEGEKQEIKNKIQEKIDYRNLKHPMNYPNIGSTFKNIPFSKVSNEQKGEFSSFTKNDPFSVVLTTKLLALAELKGVKEGDAMFSQKHPNFIVNLGNAKSANVLSLIEIAKNKIKQRWGIELEEEITRS